METKIKRKRGNPDGRAPMSDVAQNEAFQFRCTPGSKDVFKAYGENLNLDQTELFYRMIHHLGSQLDFIDFYEKNQPQLVEKNREWFESWKLVSKLCQNLFLMNKGRIKQIEDKPVDTKLVKQVADALYEHFEKKG